MSVIFFILRHFCTGKFGKRRHKVGGIDHVITKFPLRSHTGPVDNERFKTAAFEHRSFFSDQSPAANFCFIGATFGGSIIAKEHDHRIFPKFQTIEFTDKFSDELIHVLNVVSIKIFRLRRTVRRWKDFRMDMRHGIIDIKRLITILLQEINQMVVHNIGHVFLIAKFLCLAIDDIFFSFFLRVPIDTASGELQIIVETKLCRIQRQLPPFTDCSCDISGRFQNFRHHRFGIGSKAASSILVGCTGAESIPSR